MEKMFCYQCAETFQNKVCTVKGICGKTAEIANLQDMSVRLSLQELSS